MNFDKETNKIFDNSYKNINKGIKLSKKIYFYFCISLIIIFSFLIEIYELKSKINKLSKFNTKFFNNSINNYTDFINKKPKNKIIVKYINKDDSLQLYIENKTQFFIKGRQKHMRAIGLDYNESKIITIQDKLNWLLIHDSPEAKSDIVDKILLRNYSIKILGKDICVPLIKIYKNITEINLDDLPDKFVLKCNHGSGMNIICNNKSNFNLKKAKLKLEKWMKINYGLRNYEYQYIYVKKKIFAETFLKDNLTDYKFYCFNGLPKLCKVQSKYKIKNIKMYHYYNMNWEITDIETKLIGNIRHFHFIVDISKIIFYEEIK